MATDAAVAIPDDSQYLAVVNQIEQGYKELAAALPTIRECYAAAGQLDWLSEKLAPYLAYWTQVNQSLRDTVPMAERCLPFVAELLSQIMAPLRAYHDVRRWDAMHDKAAVVTEAIGRLVRSDGSGGAGSTWDTAAAQAYQSMIPAQLAAANALVDITKAAADAMRAIADAAVVVSAAVAMRLAQTAAAATAVVQQLTPQPPNVVALRTLVPALLRRAEALLAVSGSPAMRTVRHGHRDTLRALLDHKGFPARRWPDPVGDIARAGKRTVAESVRTAAGLRDSLIAKGVLPPQFATMTIGQAQEFVRQHPELASTLADRHDWQPPTGDPNAIHDPFSELRRRQIIELEPKIAHNSPAEGRIEKYRAELQQNADMYATREAFNAMTPEERQWTALLSPDSVGNQPGAPFAERIVANQVRVEAALTEERAKLADLREQPNYDSLRLDIPPSGVTDKDIAVSAGKIDHYERVLAENRQIVLFDPVHDGAEIEMLGTFSDKTRNVGVFVPGTTEEMSTFETYSHTYTKAFYDDNKDGSLVMFACMPGDLPDTVGDPPFHAAFTSYSEATGPQLSAFSRQLEQEIEASPAAGSDVAVTAVGHSYGGAVLGVSEREGAIFDQTVYIESPGMGHFVESPGDLHNLNDGVRRYTMTAPGDPIWWIQGGLVSQHGASPTGFGDNIDLPTGSYPPDDPQHPMVDGRPARQEGRDAHSGVLYPPYSDSWNAINDVINRRPVRQPAPLPDP